jgi:selenide,water dikinase
VLRPIRDTFRTEDYPDLLVGLDSPDDAAVWRLDEQRALVLTTDFFTPIVDTPYEYGAISAANSLSDIYAMGGKPFLALNVAALPPHLDTAISAEIVRGAAEKAREAGVVIAGGHTVQDKEPKFGLVVIGFVDPARMFTKGGLRVGDSLYLNKPLGFGVTATALKQEKAAVEDIEEMIGWMMRLNKAASELAAQHGVKGATDVTGFSLLGHLSEMTHASDVQAELDFSTIPFLSSARRYAELGCFPGGAADNQMHFGRQVTFDAEIDEITRLMLFDPQTSGGLCFGIHPDQEAAFVQQAHDETLPVWKIGSIKSGKGILVK